jgi:glycosyltransferase involved in cell wall biosynthesis
VRAAGFRCEPVPIERSYNLLAHAKTFRALVELFEREQFDLVHVHTPIAALVGRFAARKAGVERIVYTSHGFYFHDQMPVPKRAAFVGLEWLAGRVTDVLMTQSTEDADTARRLRLCKGGVVQAIGNGVDPARFHPPADAGDAADRARLRRELGTDPDTVVIVMIGRLVREKGYLELFAAMRDVDAELWVIGERLASDHDASIDATLAEVATDPVLHRRVKLLGYRQDVPALLRAADVFTLPSHREGMPRSVIEAMMTGLPVVATSIRGIREEVVHDETGYLVPVRDHGALAAALARVAGDRDLRARLGHAGRRRALDLYDEHRVIDRQLDLLGLRPALRDAGVTTRR